MTEKAILLINLGSPDSYNVKDVRTYLNEFLMDERVIDLPAWIRSILVKGIIVPFRAPKSAAKYKSIWTDQGSPLIHITRQVQRKLEESIEIPVELCMRYANPTPNLSLQRLQSQYPHLREVILIPLYPHYAMSSYETAVAYVNEAYVKGGYDFTLKVLPPFFDDPAYLNALASTIKPYLQNAYDHVLFSYHGIPKRHILKADCTDRHCFSHAACCSHPSAAHQVCYRHQVLRTTESVSKLLGLSNQKVSVSFQSRLGGDEWLKPFTAERFKAFPKHGIKKLIVVCPAFVSDCLETLEEIQLEGKKLFLENGGDSFTLIPCLNDQSAWINALVELIDQPGATIESVV